MCDKMTSNGPGMEVMVVLCILDMSRMQLFDDNDKITFPMLLLRSNYYRKYMHTF